MVRHIKKRFVFWTWCMYIPVCVCVWCGGGGGGGGGRGGGVSYGGYKMHCIVICFCLNAVGIMHSVYCCTSFVVTKFCWRMSYGSLDRLYLSGRHLLIVVPLIISIDIKQCNTQWNGGMCNTNCYHQNLKRRPLIMYSWKSWEGEEARHLDLYKK